MIYGSISDSRDQQAQTAPILGSEERVSAGAPLGRILEADHLAPLP